MQKIKKYRVYHKLNLPDTHRIVPEFDYDVVVGSIGIYAEETMVAFRLGNNKLTPLDGIIMYPPGTHVMEATGIRDQSGRLIWEGDIVEKTVKDNGAPPISFAVEWIPHQAKWNITGKGGNHKYKVIGNIYETPELITKL